MNENGLRRGIDDSMSRRRLLMVPCEMVGASGKLDRISSRSTNQSDEMIWVNLAFGARRARALGEERAGRLVEIGTSCAELVLVLDEDEGCDGNLVEEVLHHVA